ncbi:hypothetical protein, partial [Helicobacter pylori]
IASRSLAWLEPPPSRCYQRLQTETTDNLFQKAILPSVGSHCRAHLDSVCVLDIRAFEVADVQRTGEIAKKKRPNMRLSLSMADDADR